MALNIQEGNRIRVNQEINQHDARLIALETAPGGGGTGDVVGPALSVASEIVLFDGVTGKLIKRATTTGVLKATAGVIGAAAAADIPLDATLTALAAYNTNGLLTQTAADTFVGRTLTGTATQITVTDGNGVAGNPTLSLPADVLIPTVLTVPNTGLHLLDTNASHDLIIKPGSDITADRTLTLTTGDAARTLTISGDATVSQDYSTTGNPAFASITTTKAGAPAAFTNTTDAAANEGLTIESDRATPTASDSVYANFKLSSSTGVQRTFGRLACVGTSVVNAAENGGWNWANMIAGTLTNTMSMTTTALQPATNDLLALGTTSLMWSDLFLASGAVVNFNNSDVTLTHSAAALTMAGGVFKPTTGTTAIAPIQYTSGTNLTAAAAGVREFDGVQHYATIDTSSGRGAIPAEQYFHLTADGGTISTIANFFGATSNITLVSGAYYIIDVYAWFLNTTAGTVTWTFTNSVAPTNQNIIADLSPIAGIGVADAWSATGTPIQFATGKDVTAASAFTTGTLATAVQHVAHFKIFLDNSTGTSLKIQATKNVGGTITPRRGSYWIARRMSPNNIGTFAA